MVNLSETSKKRIKETGKYKNILQKIEDNGNIDDAFLFEALFLDCFLREGFQPDYEKRFLRESKHSIDFSLPIKKNQELLFELTNPNQGDELEREIKKQEYCGGIILSSNHQKPHLRPQKINNKVQKSVLCKVNKFPVPSVDIFSLIVVNCEKFHFGHFDKEDIRSVMCGNPINPAYQEYLDGNKVRGINKNENPLRNVSEFIKKISGVIFVQNSSSEKILDNAWIAVNPNRDSEHLEEMRRVLTNLSPTSNLSWVK